MKQVFCPLLHHLKKEDTTQIGQLRRDGILRLRVSLMQPEEKNFALSNNNIQRLGYLLSSNDTKTKSTKPQKQPTPSGVTKKVLSGVTSRVLK